MPNYQVAGVRALPADHGILVNSSAALREAIEALPLTAPVLIGFSNPDPNPNPNPNPKPNPNP